MWDKYGEFLISHHKSLADNLNKISDDLLKAKWYFMAAISAIAFAYKFVIEDFKQLTGQVLSIGNCHFLTSLLTSPHVDDNKVYFIFAICIVGNIILWLVSEYTLSHGFLFRLIQGQAAVIEKIFSSGDKVNNFYNDKYKKLINDPYDRTQFIKWERTRMRTQLTFSPDHTIPDQFVPLYWASIWLMVVNSVFGFAVAYQFRESSQCPLLSNIWLSIPVFILTSTFFIRKLLHYYLAKIRQLLKKCNFIINTAERDMNLDETNNYFIYPDSLDLLCGTIAANIYAWLKYPFVINFDTNSCYYVLGLILWSLVGYYFTTIIALPLQILVYFLSFDPACLKTTLKRFNLLNEKECVYEYLNKGSEDKSEISVFFVKDDICRALRLIRMVI